jgi:hypothetical protein
MIAEIGICHKQRGFGSFFGAIKENRMRNINTHFVLSELWGERRRKRERRF